MKDMAKTDRKAVIERIMRRLEEADDKTLREIERLVIHWSQFRKIASGKEARQAEADV